MKFAKGDAVWVRGVVMDTRSDGEELLVSFDDSDILGKDSFQVGVAAKLVRHEDDIVDLDVDLERYPLPVHAITASGKQITVQERAGSKHFVAFDHETGDVMVFNRRGVYRNQQERIDLPEKLRRYSASRRERVVAVRKPADVEIKPTREY